MTIENGNLQSGEKYTVRLLISEENRGRNDLKLFYIDENGNATEVEATRDGDYMVFETDHFSRFVITGGLDKTTSLVWLIAVLAVLLVAGSAMVAVRFVLAKKSQKATADGENKENGNKSEKKD